jgi:hypothetical protein
MRGGPRVCRQRHVAIAGGRARAVPPARLSDATALPSRRWWRARVARPMCVPPAARRDRGGTSTCCAARSAQPPSPAGAGGGRAPCGPCVCRRRRIAITAGRARAASSRCDCPYRLVLTAGKPSAFLSASPDTLLLILTPHPPGGQLSRDDHGLAWLARTLEHVLCMQPASPVTLPTAQQPARTAPSVVESLSFLHRAPSPDACRVLARRTGRPQRPAAVGRAGPL